MDELGAQAEKNQSNKKGEEESKLQNKREDSKRMGLKDFWCLKQLGSGQFGNVFLVKSKLDNSIYAMKCITKKQVLELNIDKHIQVYFNLISKKNL